MFLVPLDRAGLEFVGIPLGDGAYSSPRLLLVSKRAEMAGVVRSAETGLEGRGYVRE
jgi:hypothetical protein